LCCKKSCNLIFKKRKTKNHLSFIRLVPWSRNFNYTPHHTVNPLFLHLSFSLPFFSGWQSHPAKREPSVLFRAHRHAGSTSVEPEQKAFRAAPAKREQKYLKKKGVTIIKIIRC
jgi:hypothetical protein